MGYDHILKYDVCLSYEKYEFFTFLVSKCSISLNVCISIMMHLIACKVLVVGMISLAKSYTSYLNGLVESQCTFLGISNLMK